jgi:hypothetical protein
MTNTTIPQSLRDEAAANAARPGLVDKTKWFDVPDSVFVDEGGDEYYNVQAKFADHPILNVEKSRAARHNVYDLGIVLHTKVLRLADANPAIRNGTSHVMRFDKGEDTRVPSYRQGPDGKEVIHYDGTPGMGKAAFDAAVKDIMRCWDAWEHYQKFRKAPAHPLETRALELVSSKPMAALGTLMVDRGDGTLIALEIDDGEDHGEEETPLPPPVRRNTKRKAKATA